MFKESCGNNTIKINGNSKIKVCENKNSFYFDGETNLEFIKIYNDFKSLFFCFKPEKIEGNIIDFGIIKLSLKNNSLIIYNKEIKLKTQFEKNKIYKVILKLNRIYINKKLDIEFDNFNPKDINKKLIIGENYIGYFNDLKGYNFSLNDDEIKDLFDGKEIVSS